MFRRRRPTDPAVIDAIASLVRSPRFEVIPLKNVYEQTALLPSGCSVSVTASPAKGQDASIELAIELAGLGFEAIPHLSARMINDRSHLSQISKRLDSNGIRHAFVIAGDAEEAGEFFDGLALLEGLEDVGHSLARIGIPGYPEGHSFIPTEELQRALEAKQRYASYITTQMCFDAGTIADWIQGQRRLGIGLPVYIGLPGVAPITRLISISTRIGVGDSLRFLSGQHGLLRRLFRPGGYDPGPLIYDLGTAMSDPRVAIEGLHIYTFNQVDTTERWRQKFLAGLSDTG